MKYIMMLSIVLSSVLAAHAAPSRAPRRDTPSVPEEVRMFESGTRHLLNMNLRRAQRDLRRALRARETFPEAHNNLAFVLRKMGEAHFEEALKHYQRALELNPDLAEAHMYLGVLYVQMGNTDAAGETLAKLKDLNEDLAAELAWVIENGREKDPEQFFGVVREL